MPRDTRIKTNKNNKPALCQQQFTTPSSEEPNKQPEKVSTSLRGALPTSRPFHSTRAPGAKRKPRAAESSGRAKPALGSASREPPEAAPAQAAILFVPMKFNRFQSLDIMMLIYGFLF